MDLTFYYDIEQVQKQLFTLKFHFDLLSSLIRKKNRTLQIGLYSGTTTINKKTQGNNHEGITYIFHPLQLIMMPATFIMQLEYVIQLRVYVQVEKKKQKNPTDFDYVILSE